MAPPPASPNHSRDPLEEFLQTAVTLAQGHEAKIAVLDSRITGIERTDADCRKAQGDSWEKWTKRITDMEVEMATLKTRVATWAALGALVGTALVQLAIKLIIR